MQIIHLLVGVCLLFFGRKFYWCAVALLGLLVGIQFAAERLADQPLFIQLLAAIVAGALGAVVAVVFQRLAFALAGFLAGGYLSVKIAQSIVEAPAEDLWLWLLVGGIITGICAALLMDRALIVLTALVGAGAIVEALPVNPLLSGLLFVALAVVGVVFQNIQLTHHRHPPDRHRPPQTEKR